MVEGPFLVAVEKTLDERYTPQMETIYKILIGMNENSIQPSPPKMIKGIKIGKVFFLLSPTGHFCVHLRISLQKCSA